MKRSVRIPVAVKLAPLQTAFAHFARQLDEAGADGLVLFTRFHRADIDIEELEVVRTLPLSDSIGAVAPPARRPRPWRGASRRRCDHRRRAHRGSTSSRPRWPARTSRRWSRRC